MWAPIKGGRSSGYLTKVTFSLPVLSYHESAGTTSSGPLRNSLLLIVPRGCTNLVLLAVPDWRPQ